MMFKLCRYPPDCPNHRYITGLLTSPLPSSSSSPAAEKKKNDERSKEEEEEEEEEEQPPPWLEPITRRPLPRPLINATAGDSIEDPSNGWMDARGADHLSVFGPGKLVPLCVCPELGLAYRYVGFHVRTHSREGWLLLQARCTCWSMSARTEGPHSTHRHQPWRQVRKRLYSSSFR